MNFKKWVKSIQTAGYNGARTVYDCNLPFNIKQKAIFIGLLFSSTLFSMKIPNLVERKHKKS